MDLFGYTENLQNRGRERKKSVNWGREQKPNKDGHFPEACCGNLSSVMSWWAVKKMQNGRMFFQTPLILILGLCRSAVRSPAEYVRMCISPFLFLGCLLFL